MRFKLGKASACLRMELGFTPRRWLQLWNIYTSWDLFIVISSLKVRGGRLNRGRIPSVDNLFGQIFYFTSRDT